jgi:hypothetical protein
LEAREVNMKNYRKRRLLEMSGIRHRSDLIKEGDDLFGDDEGGGDDAADEGGGDEGGGLFGDDAGGEDKEGEEGGDKEEGEEEKKEEDEEPAEELTNDEIAEFGPGVMDLEIDGILSQIYTDALAHAQVKSKTALGYPGTQEEFLDSKIEESLSKRNLKALLSEGDEELELPEKSDATDFDMDFFCEKVANYIKNYQTLLDIEGMIFAKAKQFLLNQTNQEIASDFEEKLALIHGLDFKEQYQEAEVPQPTAVGASPAAAGG